MTEVMCKVVGDHGCRSPVHGLRALRGPTGQSATMPQACTESFPNLPALRGIFGVSNVHKSHGWLKSKAALGAVGPVSRARVSELASDHEKAPNPHQRVHSSACWCN